MKLKLVLALSGLLVSSLPTFATNIEHLDETFASGATFSGDLTFTSGWDNLTAVNGVLSGGTYGTDPISWIWDPSNNFASSYSANFGGNFLMDGSQGGGWSNFDTISWDFTNAPSLTLVSPGGLLSAYGGNNIDYSDPLVSYSFSGSVPEGKTYAEYIAVVGLIAYGFLSRRRAARIGA